MHINFPTKLPIKCYLCC